MQSKLTKAIQDKIARLKRYGAEPDHELLLWEVWIKIRTDEYVELGKKTMRQPADLQLHDVNIVREDKERKTILEHAQIPKKVGVGWSLWERPNRLFEGCVLGCDCQPVYEIKRTRAQLGRPPIMEHVGVPEYIQVKETGKIGQPIRKLAKEYELLNATYNKYRDQREEELKERIDKINPIRPDIKELIVIGQKPKPPPKPIPLLPQLIYTESTDTCHGPLQEVYALRVNNTIVYKDNPEQPLSHFRKMQQESWHEQCYSWTYYFNVPGKRMGRAKLYLENYGTVALRYCWKKIRRMIPYIPEDTYKQTFFFYKCEDVISPGQSREIVFTFISDRPGIFSESWELSISNVCLFNSLADKFIINLSGDSVENIKSINKKIEKIQCKIDKKAINRIVLSLLHEIATKATIPKHEVYPYKKKLLEADIFVMKNPVYYYHQTEVMALKEKYEKDLVPGTEWDWSIATWRRAMMDKDFDDRMFSYSYLKKSHAILLRPWYEGDDLLLAKYRAVKTILGQLADKFYDERQRLLMWHGAVKPLAGADSGDHIVVQSPLQPNELTGTAVRNIFYLHMSEHVAYAVETCAGLLSSLELNKMLDFDFCRF